jgi:predicted unusual protein kinase regulating ubiquinone biosynthesis (AarF/ABC1/UbiB family)
MGLIVVEPEDLPYFKTFLIAFLSYIETADLEDFKVSYISKINISSTPFLVSSKFVLLLRGISILEGVCKKLDPDFNFKKTLDPYIDEFIVDVNYFEARAMSDIKLITKVPDKVQVNQIQLEVLEKTIRNVEMNVRQEKKQKSFAIGGTLCTLLLDQWIGSTDVPITGIVTCILLTYFVIINGKVYKGRS